MPPVAVSPTATRPLVAGSAERSSPSGSDTVRGAVSPKGVAGGSGAGAGGGSGELSVTSTS